MAAGQRFVGCRPSASPDDDQIVPIGASALLLSKIVKNAKLEVYKGAPHGLTATHKDKVNADLLAFIKG